MPEIQVTDEQGNTHIFPDGSTMDMIAKALNVKGPASQDLTSNPNREGVYQMQGQSGSVGVPYSKVPLAAQQGYGFANDSTRFRFAKDSAADPNHPGGAPLVMGSNGMTPQQDMARANQIEDSASLPMQVVGGIAKGAGTLARPLLDAADYALTGNTRDVSPMLDARTPEQKVGKYGTIAAATLPAAVSAPVATAAGVATGTLGSAAGQLAGDAAHLSPGATTLLSDAAGLGAGAAGAEGAEAFSPKLGATAAKIFPSFFENSPEGLLTRAAKPNKNNFQWTSDAPQAIGLMKSAEQSLGHPIEGIDDAIDANHLAKQQVWQQYRNLAGRAGQMGATIDGNQIADAMMDTIGPRTAQKIPGLVQQIAQNADTYRRPLTVDEAEQFLSGKGGVNNELSTYYAKNSASRRVAEADPEMAATVAEGDALRNALYSKLDQISGPGAAQLKQAYGALSNIGETLAGRKLVWERQNPVSLAEQISTAKGVGKIAKGITPLPGIWNPGDVAEGVQNIAVARTGHLLNDPNFMIKRAFANAKPAQPFPMPSMPRVAGLLPPGATITPAPNQATGWTTPQNFVGPYGGGPYTPAMTPGERAAALLQRLRQQQPLALPAKASPLPLPPPGANSGRF